MACAVKHDKNRKEYMHILMGDGREEIKSRSGCSLSDNSNHSSYFSHRLFTELRLILQYHHECSIYLCMINKFRKNGFVILLH